MKRTFKPYLIIDYISWKCNKLRDKTHQFVFCLSQPSHNKICHTYNILNWWETCILGINFCLIHNMGISWIFYLVKSDWKCAHYPVGIVNVTWIDYWLNSVGLMNIPPNFNLRCCMCWRFWDCCLGTLVENIIFDFFTLEWRKMTWIPFLFRWGY